MGANHLAKLCIGLVLLTLADRVVGQTDPCTAFVNIGNEKRSSTYTLNVTANENSLCDSSISPDAWYSFEERTGSEIPELSSLDSLYCGSTYPIFIVKRNGETYHHEAKMATESITAPVVSSNGNFTGDIKIKYCEQRSVELGHDAFVYQLAVPLCPMSYCAGDQPACSLGTYYNGMLDQCVADLPVMSTIPSLRGPEIARNATVLGYGGSQEIVVKQFAFYCDVAYPAQPTDNGARFRVQLVLDSVLIDDAEITDANATHPSAEIVESLLQHRLGKSVQCLVRSYWFGNENPAMSGGYLSNSYWAGIKSSGYTTNTESGNRSAQIEYVSTVPITCWHCYMKQNWPQCFYPCAYSFTVHAEGLNTQYCELELSEQTVKVVLSVQVTELFPQPVSYYNVVFAPMTGKADFKPYVLWENHVIPETTIEFKQSAPLLTCDSYGDPTIKTLCGSIIQNSMDGVFNLLSSFRDTTNVNLQIQTRHVPCGSSMCNCAVAIREWNDAYIIDDCSSMLTITRILEPSSGPTSTVWSDGSGTYTVVFESGLQVVVNTVSSLSIYNTVPGLYTGYIDGVCTETVSHSTKYRIPSGDPNNMFETQPNCSYSSASQDLRCECTDSEGVAQCQGAPNGMTSKVRPKTTLAVCNPADRSGRLTWAPRTLRTAVNSDDHIDAVDVFSRTNYGTQRTWQSVVSSAWPTASGITEFQAEEHCLSTLKTSNAYYSCVGKFDEAAVLGTCKSDIRTRDKLDAAELYRSVMETYCLRAVIAMTKVTSAAQMKTNPIVRDVTNRICPKACSGHGVCINGSCLCLSKYVGPDCSIDANSSPAIRALHGNGMCDIQNRTCAFISVVASNMYDSGTITCRFRRFQLTGSSSSLQPLASSDVKGTLNTLTEVRCPTPADDFSVDYTRRRSQGYYLSISRDGVVFGNEMTLTVYDSACLTCLPGATPSCQLKTNVCLIDGVCHREGTRRNTDADSPSCAPLQKSDSSWTNE